MKLLVSKALKCFQILDIVYFKPHLYTKICLYIFSLCKNFDIFLEHLSMSTTTNPVVRNKRQFFIVLRGKLAKVDTPLGAARK